MTAATLSTMFPSLQEIKAAAEAKLLTVKDTDYIVCNPYNIGIQFDAQGNASSCGAIHATVMTQAEAERLAPTIFNGNRQPASAVQFKKSLEMIMNVFL